MTRVARRRPVWHPLPVARVDRLTAEAVAITFDVPGELRADFAFRPGQHVTVRYAPAVRRSYSICSTPQDLDKTGKIRIGVKEVPGGAFSSAGVRALGAGATLEVLPPLGTFTTDLDPARTRRYGAIVAGSGITPVLSLIATALATEPHSTFALLYGNRAAASVMFADELGALKDRYPARLQILHVLSREPGLSPALSGRLDRDRLELLCDAAIPAGAIDEWFLCGPAALVETAEAVLRGRGAPLVHTELFYAGPVTAPAPPVGNADDVTLTVRLDGRESRTTMPRDGRVLDAALAVRAELPYACKGGVCATCRARLVSGEVAMARNYALEPDDVAAGYVLTCQATPLTPEVSVDYDA
ncbi:2Fe-2S iron-sulfur cluster-binding protein [Catenuloplanes atrovinosus]|uniref:Ring-1,2-phenylacetyl-CoA epoxidase subunit PaaE n=1 Tax=Catenuloplanes atrovinosus TaxID=137266 RepID=A0AAE3YW86_9ACTN|nr:2Fe-2S iron-sulfur cluster-binding protein [Catenuloplanes atrovinosus]MDR7279715.1 ring-1,2-phenylacetyl-CoA epoxidase subunit PaaE [Catenuloplanes atrovinosus]